MENKTCFVVVGACGSYSDAQSWEVCVYLTREGAEAHAERARAAAEVCEKWKCEKCGRGWGWHWSDRCSEVKPPNPFDAEMQLDGGADYAVAEVPLLDGEETMP